MIWFYILSPVQPFKNDVQVPEKNSQDVHEQPAKTPSISRTPVFTGDPVRFKISVLNKLR